MTPQQKTAQSPVRITDTTLRDGSHAVRHQFTVEQVISVASALDRAGVEVIEVTHGDGLAGSTFNYGFSKVRDIELVAAAAAAVERARIAVLLLPGLGTVTDLKEAKEAGAQVARIATHSTEADVSIQHFGAARQLGMETVGFLMLSHRVDPSGLARQARIMADAGCQCVYVVDSAGALLPDGVTARVGALVDELGSDAQVGFHGHQNLSLGVANSIAAYRAGARQIDGTLRALGAGAGNTPTELIAAVFNALEIPTGLDVNGVLAAAEEALAPIVPRMPVADRSAIIQGRYGVYNSFLLHAERAAERYGVPAHEVLKRVGEAGYVGGQEDMIIDVAIKLRNELQGASV
ncbi:4-hydroxy-2-oxovalerate aldolase [Arthrobacter sp. NPDC089319]|uniref:4-hydroxy-2-oxovalerate aldolase n=1 Tax=Arthrobacter sp. NPDC089319 TaxID=3155915 RepID=UPI00342A4BE6